MDVLTWYVYISCGLHDKAENATTRRNLLDVFRSIQQYNIVKKREHYVKTLLVSRYVVTQWSRNNGAGGKYLKNSFRWGTHILSSLNILQSFNLLKIPTVSNYLKSNYNLMPLFKCYPSSYCIVILRKIKFYVRLREVPTFTNHHV